MTYTCDPLVDAYIERLPDWQQAICRQVRDLVHAADPRRPRNHQAHQPSGLRTARQHLRAAVREGHLNVFLDDGALIPDPQGIITAGHENTTARTVREGETINAPALSAMFKQIIANNRAGGCRKLKRESRR
jgi:hypothetical protein